MTDVLFESALDRIPSEDSLEQKRQERNRIAAQLSKETDGASLIKSIVHSILKINLLFESEFGLVDLLILRL